MKLVIKNIVRLLASMGFLLLLAPVAQAATNGRMIDDSVFDASGSMSDTDIQAFMTQFPNSCLKNYTDDMPVADPANAYFNYSGTGSAAQIIRRVSDNYGINPRVLLTKLEQEENLVTGNAGCANWRLASATGFDCSDGNSPRTVVFRGATIQTCVHRDANLGVARQLSKGGWLLKWGKERANGNMNWLTPDDAVYTYSGPMTQGNRKRCGSCATVYYDGYWNGVYLESGATASLYNYTPYLGQAFDDIWEGWWGAGSSMNANYGWQFISSTPSKDLTAVGVGDRVQITLIAKNTGNRTWSNTDNPIRVGTWAPTDHSSNYYDPSWLSGSRTTTLQEATVPQGSNGTFIFWVQAPSSLGSFNERFNLVSDGVSWFSDPGYAIFMHTLPLTPAATLVSGALPTSMTANASSSSTITVRNDSNVTWHKTGPFPVRVSTLYPFNRSSQFQTANWLSENRPALQQEATVSPGQNATFIVTLKAPPRNGVYDERFGLIQDGLTGQPIVFGGNITVSGGVDVVPIPIYRLYNPRNGDHFNVSSIYGRDAAVTAGYRFEGVEFYAYDSQIAGTVPIYRLYQPSTGDHFNVASIYARDAAVNAGFRYEGIEFYAFDSQVSGSAPVYRLYQPSSGDHFNAASIYARDAAVNAGFRYEGVEFFSAIP